MRIKLGLSMVLSMLACDDRVVIPDLESRANQHDQDDAPHPYLSCLEGEVDPVCEAECGDEGASDDPHTICGIPCSDASECEGYGGDSSTIACIEGRCYVLCQGDADCPEGLECAERNPIFGAPHPDLDECKAPGRI